MKRKKSAIKIIKPTLDKSESSGDMGNVEALASKAVKEKMENVGMIISRVDYPVELKYNGLELSLAPRQKMKVANIDLVEKLPLGVIKAKI